MKQTRQTKSRFRWPVRVYYEDTDAGGLVYYANYMAFYERARTEMLRQYNINQQELFRQKLAFVVRHAKIEYRAAARLDDLLEVQTEVIGMSRTTLTFAQTILNRDGRVLNQAEVLVVCINPLRMKPVALPEPIVVGLTQ